ncbi:hypothetical protein [Paraurantiacibacter namhicola]|uniref:Uncharacterized protein n=1 Tax=Paraurantiacibacter namhicola TaxID=645517 RepID=A0A1C7D8B7_9SPHN|nr:hypothetical protein [Paraurantiacibacter namhicola]ANU07719.1 hypothetical protein A6F65_01414 [Paraurantiacibacter namhicola]
MTLLSTFLASTLLLLQSAGGAPAVKIAPEAVLENAQPAIQGQVRVRQSVVIRISPPAPAESDRALAEVPRRKMNARYQEERVDGCVRIESIAGSKPLANNRLLLFMRDRGILTISLDRVCSAQSFYSGFYVERNGDGMLCPGRDKLRSRNGMECEVGGLGRLVAIRD